MPYLSVATGYTDKASCTWNAETRTGSFVLHDDGELHVIVQIFNGDYALSNPLEHPVTLSLVVEEGIYYFKSKQLGKYMQIDDGNSDYDVSGTAMKLCAPDSNNYQKWRVLHVVDGYYKILSVKSDFALCVESEDTNTNAAILVQEAFADFDRMKWKITESSSGAYVVRPKSGAGAGTDWCMSVGTQTVNPCVEQKAYINDSHYEDEWILEVEHASTFVAIYEKWHHHREAFEAVQTSLTNMGYGNSQMIETLTVAECLNEMVSSIIFYSRSHGSQEFITLKYESNDELIAVELKISDMNNLGENALKNCRLVFYGACYTGQGREISNNLVNSTQAKGAITVIGFEKRVYCDELTIWANAFFDALENGSTMEEACRYADDFVPSCWQDPITTDSWYIAGSKTQTLN